MNQTLNNYINQNYYELQKICKKYTKNDDWANELLHDVLLQLLEKKTFEITNENQIKYYIVRIIQINWCQPTSPFNRKIKNIHLNDLEITEALNLYYDDSELDEHQLLNIIENEWSELDWFNKVIFEKYLTLGSLKKVSIDTTIPLRSVHRYITSTKQTIKNNTKKRINNGM